MVELRSQLVLSIYVAEHCPGCREARRLAVKIAANQPCLVVELIDVGDPQAVVPEAVFATPTYMLNDRVISLGNPSLAELTETIRKAALRLG